MACSPQQSLSFINWMRSSSAAKMLVDLTFADGYRVELPDELPGYATNMTFIPPVGAGGRDGLLIQLRSDTAHDWLGCFAFGQFGIGFSAVIASPQPGWLFVISAGAGYIVNTTSSSEWEEVACTPVREANVIAERNMVLFADFTTVAAYGRNGLAWKSPRLCWDELHISSIQENKLHGTGYDPTNSSKPYGEFTVDLLTGQVLESDFDYAYKQHLF